MTQTNNNEKKSLFVEMDTDLYWQLKEIALKKKTTVKSVIVDMIQREVE